jgi:hypothetical protein
MSKDIERRLLRLEERAVPDSQIAAMAAEGARKFDAHMERLRANLAGQIAQNGANAVVARMLVGGESQATKICALHVLGVPDEVHILTCCFLRPATDLIVGKHCFGEAWRPPLTSEQWHAIADNELTLLVPAEPDAGPPQPPPAAMPPAWGVA